MPNTFYLRPLGLFSLPVLDDEEPHTWRGLPLAGGPSGFAAVEVIVREGLAVRRQVFALGEVFERDWPRHTETAASLLAAISAPRARLAGLDLKRPLIMGIVNVTPDSFSDGGHYASAQAAIDHGVRLLADGADILDIGGESTRPGASPVTLDEELRRVIPLLEGLRSRTEAPLSVDTRKAEVMRRAAQAGADILNDVSALTHDPNALGVAAESGLPVILMHAQGDPRTMNESPDYEDVLLDVYDFLESRIRACEDAGIPRAKLVVDPGIGFGKHLPHNVAVLAGLSLFHGLGVPILLGASRKKLIGQICNVEDPKDRVPGSLAAALAGIAQGVQIVRVHDVAATRQAVAVWDAVGRGTEIGLLAAPSEIVNAGKGSG